MVSNEEIKFKLKCIGDRINSEEAQKILETEIPHKWVENACLFDFDSISVEDLSNYIEDLFEWWGYHLEEGTPVDGIYGYGSALKFLSSSLLLSLCGLVSGLNGMRYRFKVEIFLSNGETYLKISKAI